MRSIPHIRVGTLLCATLLTLALTLLQSGIASAHFEGDKWVHPGYHYFALNYANNCSPASFQAAADAAAQAWSGPQTPIVLRRVGGNCQPQNQNISLFTGSDSNTNNLAWTQNYEQDCFITCYLDADWNDAIVASDIRMNTVRGSFVSLNAHDKQAAVTHEMGHSLGLAHAGYYAGESNGDYSVMDYCCFTNVPLQHDWDDINRLYP